MPTIDETWEQLDQESVKIAWEKQVDHKGFEIAWRIELRRLAEDAKRELGYVYVFLGGTGRTERQRVREEVDYIEARMAHRELPNPRLHHLHKFLDALLRTYRQHGRKGEHDTTEFLWAIFFIGVVDRVDPRRENTYRSSPLILDARRYLVVLRDQVELEVHKLQHEQSVELEAHKLQRAQAEAHEKDLMAPDENRPVAQHDEKEGTRTDTEMRSTCRAETVGKIIRELNILKPQMFGEQNYDELKTKHPGFLTFGIADQRNDLKLKLVNLQEHRQHIRLAQELAASCHGKQRSTIEKDWKRYKPIEFRKKKG